MPTSKSSADAQREHVKRTEAYAQEVKAQYVAAMEEMLELCKRLPKLATGQMFSFDATTEKQRAGVQQSLRRLHAANVAAIHEGSRQEWGKANDATDALLRSAIGKSAMEDPALAGWLDRGERAEEAFMKRNEGGMDLSDRIWKNTRQFRDEMEVAMTVAIGEGTSAQAMSRTVRKYLNDPDLMFRRFRYKDEDGNWQRKWKKKVMGDDGKVRFIDYDRDSYRTGAGVYKSAYRNAMRVTRTETNMAYRQADHDRWQRLDFILGQRIDTSNAHTEDDEDICDQLAGDYPRDFTFTGWHPQCMCFCTPIMADPSDVAAAARARMDGKDYTLKSKPVTTYPKGFRDFVKDNKDALQKAIARGNAPYFIDENMKVAEALFEGKEPPVDLTVKKQPRQLTAEERRQATLRRAAERHAARTPEQEEAIRKAWQEHEQRHAQIKADAKAAIATAGEYKEVDATALADLTAANNLTKMPDATKALQQAIDESRKKEAALADIIPDVHKWHKDFTITKLQNVHDSLEKTFKSWSNLSLDDQMDKAKEMAEFYKQNAGLSSTWEVHVDALNKKFDELFYKSEKKKAFDKLKPVLSWLTNHPNAVKTTQAYAEAQDAYFNNAKLFEINMKVDKAVNLYNAQLKAEATRAAKKAGKYTTGKGPFTQDAYTQARKDAAVWDTGKGMEAYRTLGPVASKVWLAAPREEDAAIYEYTHKYRFTNEPLQNRHYIAGHYQDRASFTKRVGLIQSYIERNELPCDMWLQRGEDDGLPVLASRFRFRNPNATFPSDPAQWVGLEIQEGGFMSSGSSKGAGFKGDLMFNIYAPKGTKAAYVEPFSRYGNGDKTGNWNGKLEQTEVELENETLFQRGTIMRITKVEQAGGVTYVDCEVIGQELKDLSYVPDRNLQ